MKWKRQPPEHESGEWFFDGDSLATAAVTNAIPNAELAQIANELSKLAIESGGLDYLQIYVHEETNVKLWVIDDKTHFTILFPSDY